jgi:hypothetical protein
MVVVPPFVVPCARCRACTWCLPGLVLRWKAVHCIYFRAWTRQQYSRHSNTLPCLFSSPPRHACMYKQWRRTRGRGESGTAPFWVSVINEIIFCSYRLWYIITRVSGVATHPQTHATSDDSSGGSPWHVCRTCSVRQAHPISPCSFDKRYPTSTCRHTWAWANQVCLVRVT